MRFSTEFSKDLVEEWTKILARGNIEIGWSRDHDYKTCDMFRVAEFCPIFDILKYDRILTVRLTADLHRSTYFCPVFEVKRCIARRLALFPPNPVYPDCQYTAAFDYGTYYLLNLLL